MIHPMWATFYAALLPVAIKRVFVPGGGGLTYETATKWAAELADRACEEYDKRDKAGGSPYR